VSLSKTKHNLSDFTHLAINFDFGNQNTSGTYQTQAVVVNGTGATVQPTASSHLLSYNIQALLTSANNFQSKRFLKV
jgi:hypothetical protein